MPELVSSTHAVQIITSGDTVVVGGFINQTAPLSLLRAMNTLDVNSLGYFCTTGVVAAGVLNMDMFNRTTAAHYGLLPNIQQAVADGKIRHRIIPQGILTEMLRTGNDVTSKIGKGTFLDSTLSDEITYIAPFSFDVALVRAKQADQWGNILLHKLSVDTENAMMTCKQVIVEVDEIVDYFDDYKMQDHDVVALDHVDYIVLTEEKLTNEDDNNLETNTKSIPEHIENYIKRIPDHLLTLQDNVINLGIGLPEALAPYLDERVHLTVEAGILGGKPRGGKDFGMSDGDDVKYFNHNDMFQMYWGGLLDVAVMGVGEFDHQGNVNVHDFGGKLTGCGGFIDITQSARKVIFCGKESKLVDKVSSVTFNPNVVPDQEVYYLTEKAIYVLDNGKLVEYS